LRNIRKSLKKMKKREPKRIEECSPKLLTRIGSRLNSRRKSFSERRSRLPGDKVFSIPKPTASDAQELKVEAVALEVSNLIIVQDTSTLTKRESRSHLVVELPTLT
jgi:hypothetical protein